MCVCLSVCLFVCLSVRHILPLERLFVLKSMSRTQRATKGQKNCGDSAPLRSVRENAHAQCISARFSRCIKHEGRGAPGLPKTLPTDVASPCVFTVFERLVASCVSVLQPYFSCARAYIMRTCACVLCGWPGAIAFLGAHAQRGLQ